MWEFQKNKKDEYRFKSHRDKVKIQHQKDCKNLHKLVSNPIGTKLKFATDATSFVVAVFQIP